MKNDLIKKGLFSLTTLLIFTSCGNDKLQNIDKAKLKTQLSSSVIIEDVDWQEIDQFDPNSQIYQNSRFVGKLNIPMMNSRCTGLLISKDLFLTNHHCIPHSFYATNATVSFNHTVNTDLNKRTLVKCDQFIGNNQELDYAILKCEQPIGQILGFAKLNESETSKGTPIYVIHQNCDYYNDPLCDPTKKVSEGEITLKSNEYVHNADTLGGSSGSPVFSKISHKVVALHHAGLGNGQGDGRGSKNFAVPMEKIVQSIRDKFPNLFVTKTNSSTKNMEPNDSFETSFLLDPSVKIDGTIDENDFDYFKVQTLDRKQIVIELNLKHINGDLDLYLYHENEKLIKKSISTTDKEKIVKTLDKGTYIILVKGYRGAKGEYHLNIK